jgi:prepilin-type N-terminal cleavage/methylation domain-containing protein
MSEPTRRLKGSAGRPRREGAGGYTLVEMSVSMAIFVVLAVMGASILVKTTRFCTESIFRSDIMESGKIGQERLFDQLFSAKVISLLPGGPAGTPVLTVVVPVEVPIGGGLTDYLDTNGKVNWGAVEATGPILDLPGSPHQVTITVRITGTVTEKDAGLDLNMDGDLLDSFQVGTLVMRTTGGEETVLVTGKLVLGEIGKGAFDMDGDKVVDPLFAISGETFTDANKNGVHDDGESFTDTNANKRWDGTLSVNLLAFSRDRDGRGHRFVYKTSLKLLNN